MGKFSGRIALVTAATEGIGYAIARSLAQEGAHVVICSRKQVKVDEALQQLQREGLSVSGNALSCRQSSRQECAAKQN